MLQLLYNWLPHSYLSVIIHLMYIVTLIIFSLLYFSLSVSLSMENSLLSVHGFFFWINGCMLTVYMHELNSFSVPLRWISNRSYVFQKDNRFNEEYYVFYVPVRPRLQFSICNFLRFDSKYLKFDNLQNNVCVLLFSQNSFKLIVTFLYL